MNNQASTSSPEKKSELSFNLISVLLGTGLTIYSAFLYFTGRFYYFGFLDSYHIKPELFPVTTQEIIFWGATAHYSMGIDLVKLLIKGMIGYAVIFAIFYPVLKKVYQWEKKSARNNQDSIQSQPSDRTFLLLIMRVLVIPCTLILIIAFLFIGVAGTIKYASNNGREGAPEIINAIKANKNTAEDYALFAKLGVRITTVIRSDKQKLYEGYLITCSDKYCALYDKEGLHTFPLDPSISFLTQPFK